MGRIRIYDLVNPWIIFIIITLPNIYFEDLFPVSILKTLHALSYLILSKPLWDRNSYCPCFTDEQLKLRVVSTAWRDYGCTDDGLFPWFSYNSPFFFISLFSFTLLWILISGFVIHRCHIGHYERKLHNLYFVLHAHHLSHARYESVCSIITLSIVYSKHTVINTPSKAEERRKQVKKKVNEEKEGKNEKRI